MKKLLASTLVASLVLSATAFAGGPVVVEEETEVVVEKSNSSGGILPIIGIGVLLCLAICGNDDDEQPVLSPA